MSAVATRGCWGRGVVVIAGVQVWRGTDGFAEYNLRARLYDTIFATSMLALSFVATYVPTGAIIDFIG